MSNRVLWAEEEIQSLRENGLFNQIRTIGSPQGAWLIVDGKKVLNFCSNNYLGLANHPKMINAVKKVVDEYGVGPGAVRSIAGTMDIHLELEKRLAQFKGVDACISFQSGFTANLATIPCLVGKEDGILSDELNHASIIDGCRLSGATIIRFNHADAKDLEKKILENKGKYRRLLVITDGVFSMDGDLAPLDELYQLSEKYDVHIMLDDAHGTGIFGENGTGVEELFGLSGKMDTHMATFGKALGSFGAFALADNIVIDFLINRARTFMYTTALPIPSLAASLAALNLIKNNPSLKDELWHNIDYMRKKLLQAGFDLKKSIGPIVPIVVGEDKKTLRMQDLLLQKGLFLQAIRPPTVPEGASRLRLTIVRGLTVEEMDYAIETLIDTGKKMKLI